LHSRVDCNPRVVYEGLVADTPFFVTEVVRLPDFVQHLGHMTDGDPTRMAERLADFVDLCEAGGFSGRPREFARRNLVESEVYRKMVEWMDQKYLSGKFLDPVIKGEEALSLSVFQVIVCCELLAVLVVVCRNLFVFVCCCCDCCCCCRDLLVVAVVVSCLLLLS
ncbi:unnamed protein product, partial [Polarella glacialis]